MLSSNLNQQGPIPKVPQNNYGLGTNYKPKTGGPLSGFSLPNKQTVANPVQGAGQPSTIRVSTTQPPTQSAGIAMPSGFNAGNGVGMGSSNYGLGNYGGFLQGFGSGNKDIKSITDPSGNKIDLYSDNKAETKNAGGTAGGTPPTMYQGALTDYGRSIGATDPNASSNRYSPGTNGNNGTSFQQNLGNVQGTGSYTPQEQQIYGGLMGQSQDSSKEYKQAQSNYQKAIEDYNKSVQSEAGAMAGEANRAIPLGFVQGRQQVLQGQYAAQQAGLGGLAQGASAALGAANTQQQTQQAAGVAAGNLAQTQAQRNYAAQSGVMGATQPQPYGVTTTPYQPGSNTYGQMAGTNAGGGGLQNVGYLQGQMGVGQDIAQLNSFLGGAQTVGNNLNSLIKENNINPSGLTYINGALQFGASKLSNPAYQKFAGQINDFVASLAPILGAGGNPSDMKTRMSSQIVDAMQSGQTIQEVVSYFLDQAKQKVQGQAAGGGVNTGGGSNGGYATAW